LSQASWDRLEMKSKRNKGKRNTKKDTTQEVEIGVNKNRNKGNGSGTLIGSLQALRSIANSLEIFHSLRFRTPLCTGASRGLRWTYPNHLNRCWINFSLLGATLTLSRISLSQTLSLLEWPQNQRNIRISTTLNCWTCCLFVGQHSAPITSPGELPSYKTYLLAFVAPSYHRGCQKLDAISTNRLKFYA
jgi:hypothetical protein